MAVLTCDAPRSFSNSASASIVLPCYIKATTKIRQYIYLKEEAQLQQEVVGKRTLCSQCGLSAQQNMARASIAAGIVDNQKQTRHLSTKNSAITERLERNRVSSFSMHSYQPSTSLAGIPTKRAPISPRHVAIWMKLP